MNNDDKRFDRCYAEINLAAIRHNIVEQKKLLGQSSRIMAVIKADAYGHGAIQVARTLSDFVCGFGVALPEEALKLRGALIDNMILDLGFTGPEWYEDMVRHDISMTVYDYQKARLLDSVASAIGKKAKVHFKVDTGMGRIGFPPTPESVRLVKEIASLPGIEAEGIFTHFARADEATPDAAKEPFETFLKFVKACEDEGMSFKYKHAANSAAILHFRESSLDLARSGISTYGLYPSEEMPHDMIKLQPAMRLVSCVSYVKEVPAGTPISYGGTYVTEKPSIIATVPMGYADGIRRTMSNRGKVLINGQFAPIVGRICMDQFMVDVTDIPNVKILDEVVIIGRQGNNEITVEEVAELSESFNYEIICAITNRVPRKYIG